MSTKYAAMGNKCQDLSLFQVLFSTRKLDRRPKERERDLSYHHRIFSFFFQKACSYEYAIWKWWLMVDVRIQPTEFYHTYFESPCYWRCSCSAQRASYQVCIYTYPVTYLTYKTLTLNHVRTRLVHLMLSEGMITYLIGMHTV